jgi:S1-C subfamily serine protease
MSENPLVALSDRLADVVEHAARAAVAVRAGRSWSSGIHWRAGVVVTAEEVLDRDDDIRLVLPGGRELAATLAGRDPSTDVAVLRFQADGLPMAEKGDSASLRVGNIVLAVGSHQGAAVAAPGTIAFIGGAWTSRRGGAIDSLLRLDLALSPALEGAALADVAGRVVGMAVTGPRGRALAIPTATIDRAVDQLLAKGYVGRGYLGAGLQPVRSGTGGGILVVSIDPSGPAASAGLIVGDVVTSWAGEPIGRVREVMRRLGPDSVGRDVELALLRGGGPHTLKIVIGERPRH